MGKQPLNAKVMHRKLPCAECPWRKDVPVGKFPVERYRHLAETTACDLATTVFACHQSPEGKEFGCAGYIHQFQHNLRLRVCSNRGEIKIEIPEGMELFRTFREMAVANGVAPDDLSLKNVRD